MPPAFIVWAACTGLLDIRNSPQELTPAEPPEPPPWHVRVKCTVNLKFGVVALDQKPAGSSNAPPKLDPSIYNAKVRVWKVAAAAPTPLPLISISYSLDCAPSFA
jgi:hypothetical protein